MRNLGLAAGAAFLALESPGALAVDRLFGVGGAGTVEGREALGIALASTASLATFALASQALRLQRSLKPVVNPRALP